jgi:hypothetical protein
MLTFLFPFISCVISNADRLSSKLTSKFELLTSGWSHTLDDQAMTSIIYLYMGVWKVKQRMVTLSEVNIRPSLLPIFRSSNWSSQPKFSFQVDHYLSLALESTPPCEVYIYNYWLSIIQPDGQFVLMTGK